jgi:hypothetical protein
MDMTESDAGGEAEHRRGEPDGPAQGGEGKAWGAHGQD